MTYLKDKDRGMILLLLDKVKVEATGDPKYIPLLEAWERVDYERVRRRIRQAIGRLSEARDRLEGKWRWDTFVLPR